MKDYFNYSGKNCVVTGAASGMGKAAAEALVDMGAKVYALDWAETTIPGTMKNIHVNLGDKILLMLHLKNCRKKLTVFLVLRVFQALRLTFSRQLSSTFCRIST